MYRNRRCGGYNTRSRDAGCDIRQVSLRDSNEINKHISRIFNRISLKETYRLLSLLPPRVSIGQLLKCMNHKSLIHRSWTVESANPFEKGFRETRHWRFRRGTLTGPVRHTCAPVPMRICHAVLDVSLMHMCASYPLIHKMACDGLSWRVYHCRMQMLRLALRYIIRRRV